MIQFPSKAEENVNFFNGVSAALDAYIPENSEKRKIAGKGNSVRLGYLILMFFLMFG